MKPIRPVGVGLLLLALLSLCGAVQAAPVPGDDDKALRDKALQLNEPTGEDAITGTIMNLVDDKEKERSKKLLAVALKMSKAQEKDKPPFNVNATWILARTAQVLREYDTSEYFYRQHVAQAIKLYSSKRIVSAYDKLMEVLYAAKKFDEVERLCQDILAERGPRDEELARIKLKALETLVKSLSKQNKTEQALKLVENLIKLAKQDDNEIQEVLMSELKGMVLREAGKVEEAAKLYESLITRIYKIERLKKETQDDFADTLRYTLSGLYIDLKNVNKAAEHLKALLARDEKNPSYNNDLGYIWADNDMNLDEAEKLVRRAIDEERRIRKKIGATEKDNAAYLDSLGWVLYKKKKYKEALEHLLEAVKDEENGQHLEIYDHLAEVYIALDQKDKALEAWKKGLNCKPVSKRDDQRKIEVEKKMKMHEKK